MPWKTDNEPSAADKLSPREHELLSKLSPQGRATTEKIMLADKKTQAMAAFQLVLCSCWEEKDKKINKEQFFDITDTLFDFLWLTATMETARLVSSGPESLAENLVLLQIYGSQKAMKNARKLQNLMEMLK